jgi:hypothetical protein
MKCSFVGEKILNIIKMHGTTIKIDDGVLRLLCPSVCWLFRDFFLPISVLQRLRQSVSRELSVNIER